MNNGIIYGYKGFLGSCLPPAFDTGSLSIFYMTDNIKSVLIAIPLCPGFYRDLVKTVYSTSFVNVIIIMPSIDQNMISDLIMTVKMASILKGVDYVRWVSPDDTEWDSDIMNITHIRSNKLFINQICESKFDMEPMFIFSEKPHVTRTNSNVYDIIVWTGYKTISLIQYPNFYSLHKLYEKNKTDEIHLPWKPSWGGLSGIEIVDDICSGKVFNEKLRDKYYVSNEELQTLSYEQMEHYKCDEIGESEHSYSKYISAINKLKEKFRFHSFTSNILYNTMRYKFGINCVDFIEGGI